MAAAPPDGDVESLGAIPDLRKAIEVGYVSFSQLAKADWNRSNEGPLGAEYRQLYPKLLHVFQVTHGLIEDRYSIGHIHSDVARTAPASLATQTGQKMAISPSDSASLAEQKTAIRIPERARHPDFHFVYDLARVPIGGELLTRLEMLASDATRVLGGRKLIECLDQLYSKATDALGIIDATAASHSNRNQTDESLATAKAGGKVDAPPAQPTLTPAERLAIINRDLDVIELKYLITDARLQYFVGSVASTLAIGVLVVVGAALGQYVPTFRDLGRAFALVMVFGAVGALLSVVQRMSSGSLVVRYDLDTTYVRLLGAFRPVLGAFGGVLVWLLAQAKVLSNPTGSDFFFAALAFALGIAERSLGDVVSASGIATKLTPCGSDAKPGGPAGQ